MSFAELQAADYSRRKEEIVIKSGDKELKFYAGEISYLQKLNLAAIQQTGGDSYSQLVVYSITDENGHHMSLEQAHALAPEHQELFFIAAAKVNNSEEAKKKAKRKR